MTKKYHVSIKTDLITPNFFTRIRNIISEFFMITKKITPEDKESISSRISDIREKDKGIFEYNLEDNIVKILEEEINSMGIADHDYLRDNWMQSNYYMLEKIGMKDKADELRKIEDTRREKNNGKGNNFKEALKVNFDSELDNTNNNNETQNNKENEDIQTEKEDFNPKDTER